MTTSMSIPRRLLIAAEPFGSGLPAQAVAEAIGRGVTDAGAPAPDRCPLVVAADGDGDFRVERPPAGRRALGALLEALEFDRRMRAARAVVVAAARLDERALVGSPAFEIATRARQAGVPAYAVSADSPLGPFDARILDLQSVLVAGNIRELRAAGRTLAALS